MVSLVLDPAATAGEPAPGEIRVKLSNSGQAWHLLQALRGHCEVDMFPGSEGTMVVVSGSESGSRPVLKRLDAWLSEFGVETITLELDGRSYEMKKTSGA